MEATSITQTKNMIIDQIRQPLSEKIKCTGAKIQDALINGAIDSASEAICDLSSWFEDLAWKVYLTSLFKTTMILSWIRKLGAKKGMRLVSYQTIRVTLSTGTKIQIRSPFFIKASPKRGRKKRGPQKRGEHLLLSVMGFVNKIAPELAFRAIQLSILSPSFDMASKTLKQEGINLSANQIRRLVSEMENPNLCSRVDRVLSDDDASLFKNRRILLAADGGRLRQRKNKRGPWPSGYKRCGFHTDWIEPKLFTLYILDEDGNIVKDIAPFVDGTTGKVDEFIALLKQYLVRLKIGDASEVVLIGDGAPWIWERIPKLIRSIGGDELKLTEIIDWTHAKQNLNKAFEMLPKKKREMADFNHFKNLLFSGKINEMVSEVKSFLNVRASSKTMKKLKSYFVSNSTRMQYEASRSSKLPTGSGVIESAIRRVINMRVKSPGSFWKLDFVETVIYLRAQVLYGRWGNIIKNWAHSLRCDFMDIAAKAEI